MTRMTAAFSVFSMAVSLTLTLAPAAQADPIQATYSTSGTIGTSGLNGTPVLSYQGVNNDTLTTGQPFDLGQFVIDGPPSSSGTSYVNTPFIITMTVQSINGAVPSPNEPPAVLEGWLNGTVQSNSVSSVNISFASINFYPEQMPPFPTNITPFETGTYKGYLEVVSGDDVYNPINAELNLVLSAPEPRSIIVFGVLGMALIRLRRRRSLGSS